MHSPTLTQSIKLVDSFLYDQSSMSQSSAAFLLPGVSRDIERKNKLSHRAICINKCYYVRFVDL